MSIVSIMGIAKKETGICVSCGKKTAGAAAKPDTIIRAARKIRSLLKMPPSHTVACQACTRKCAENRKKFEKKRWNYNLAALAFFLLVIGGSVFYGNLELPTILAAVLGALFIAALPYAYYFPNFEAEK